MLRKKFVAALAAPALALIITNPANAQDSTVAEKKTTITGSVDAYYRYSFLNAKDIPSTNNATSFTNSHNSFEIGMASVKVDHSFGKVSGVLDLGFGTRAKEFSYNDDGITAAVKQAYLTYAPSDKVKFTMGKFGTHVGYELLDPQLNRNYSMSYMFSYGPFFHTGLKADISISDNVSFMVGVANPTDMTSASFEKKFFLGQFHAATKDGNLSGYLNFVGGKNMAEDKSTQFDLVVTGKVSDKFSIGYNGTTRSLQHDKDPKQSFWGSALYLNFDPSSTVGLTLRGEMFDDKDNGTDGYIGTSIFAATLSANIKVDGFTIIPEFRLDNAKDNFFIKNSGDPTKSGAAFILAAVYSF
ncbi:MAG: porin [Chitinophagaceae bacterium]|nr:porin [Chitinophagaceae bacterium]